MIQEKLDDYVQNNGSQFILMMIALLIFSFILETVYNYRATDFLAISLIVVGSIYIVDKFWGGDNQEKASSVSTALSFLAGLIAVLALRFYVPNTEVLSLFSALVLLVIIIGTSRLDQKLTPKIENKIFG